MKPEVTEKLNAALDERTRRSVAGTQESIHVVSIRDDEIAVISYNTDKSPRPKDEKIISIMYGLGEGRYWASKMGFYTRDDVEKHVEDERKYFWKNLEKNGRCEGRLTKEELETLLETQND